MFSGVKSALPMLSEVMSGYWFRIKHRNWKPYSRLLLIPESRTWVVAWEMMELHRIADRLGINCMIGRQGLHADRQSIFFGSRYELFSSPSFFRKSNRLSTAYFHGMPGTGIPEFDRCYQSLCRRHEKISRIQVTHSAMRDMILGSGIAAEKVFLIPIGINLDFFSLHTPDTRRRARNEIGIPQSAVVVGSFQKDGVGWDEGNEPKMIKGPDVLIKTLKILKKDVPELFVLLSGPSRGYVKNELSRIGIPWCHKYLAHYPDIGELYQALDLYIVASRQEGGPKAIFESMACGIPIVTTRVGQAMDLVRQGQNGFMADVENAEELAGWSKWILEHPSDMVAILARGRATAEENAYERQLPLWKQFMNGFVEM